MNIKIMIFHEGKKDKRVLIDMHIEINVIISKKEKIE
jgi:hypothetical protein